MNPLINIIYASLNDTGETFKIDKELYLLFKRNHLECFLENTTSNDTEDNIKAAIRKSILNEMTRNQKQYAEKDAIVKAFNDNKIHFMFIKGFNLKQYYPKPYYRFMCDMDILVSKKDLKKVSRVLKNIGYQKSHESDHDISFKKEPIFYIELHYLLIPKKEHGKNYFVDIDKKISTLNDSSYEMRFNKIEDEYIFYFFHLLKHYEEAGMGIRNFIDLVLFINNHPNLDFDYIHQSFESTKYKEDCYKLENLIFNLRDKNRIDDETINLITNIGLFGTIETRIQKESKKHKNTFSWILSKAFPNFQTMQMLYPLLKHWYLVFLLPFCYIHRLIRFTFFKRKIAKEKINIYKKIK